MRAAYNGLSFFVYQGRNDTKIVKNGHSRAFLHATLQREDATRKERRSPAKARCSNLENLV